MNKYKISKEDETWHASGDGEIFDKVTNPKHCQGNHGLEVEEMLRSYYKGKILKYLLHERNKNGLEDLKKARKHLDWLIELEENNSEI